MKPSNRAYLDWNAGAPLRPEVRAAMIEAFSLVGNPSSVHAFGREARRQIENARRHVARLVGAAPEQVVFTSGGVEANHLALLGMPKTTQWTSSFEHESVLAATPNAERLPATLSGLIDLEKLDLRLKRFRQARAKENATPLLVSTMLVNNETGVIQPIAEISTRVRQIEGIVHCDAAQALGRLPIDIKTLGVDLLTVSAHKIGGPQGVGAVILAEPPPSITPIQRGGGQENRRRAGTENCAGIIGFGCAAELALQEVERYAGLVEPLRDRLEQEVRRARPDAWFFGAESPRVGNTSCFGVPGLRSETLVMKLDLAGVAVSAGAACSSGRAKPSHVISAMGYDEEATAAAIRISLGPSSRVCDIDLFLDACLPFIKSHGASQR